LEKVSEKGLRPPAVGKLEVDDSFDVNDFGSLLRSG
jgi:hypothetical protein